MTPEKKVQNKILKYLKDLSETAPVFFERRQAGGFGYKTGIPDVYAVINGIHLEIEVKKPGGKMSPMQEKFRDLCAKKKVLWLCAENLDSVKRVVEELLDV